MLAMKVGQFPVETVLVEEKIDIDREFFLSFAIDDAARAPVIIFAAGGAGIEERAASTKRIDPAKHGYDGSPPRGISDGNPKSKDPNPREKGDQR
jgi:succinyl-CoA synthetase beta subunit